MQQMPKNKCPSAAGTLAHSMTCKKINKNKRRVYSDSDVSQLAETFLILCPSTSGNSSENQVHLFNVPPFKEVLEEEALWPWMLSAVWQHLNRSSSLKAADNRNPFTHAVHKGCCETHFGKDWLQNCDHQHCFFNLNLNQKPILNILFTKTIWLLCEVRLNLCMVSDADVSVWGVIETLSSLVIDWRNCKASYSPISPFFFSLQIKPGCPLPAREKVTQDVTCLSQ